MTQGEQKLVTLRAPMSCATFNQLLRLLKREYPEATFQADEVEPHVVHVVA